MNVRSQNSALGRLAGAGDQGPHHFLAGGVAQGMGHAAMAVPPFLRQRQLAVFDVEVGPPLDQLLNPLGSFADDHFHDLLVAQPLAGGHRVGGMARNIIDRIEDPGDAPLSIGAVRLRQHVFADDDRLEAAA